MRRFQNILFVKSADHNEVALALAAALARHNQAGLKLIETSEEIPDVSVFGFPDETVKEVKQAALEDRQEALEQLAELHRGPIQIETGVLEGNPFLETVREVLRNGHDLVIKTAEGDKGPVSSLFSTTGMHLFRKCPCPVWLVKPGQSKAIKRIVAAVDFDEPGDEGKNTALNKQILEMAISLAHREKAELHVVHAWQAIAENILSSGRSGLPEQEVKEYIAEVKASSERRLSEVMDQARSWVGRDVFDAVKPKTHVIKGRAQEVIAEQTRTLDANLLVMGTVGRIGISGFFIGNTAESILNWIDCSVLAVKPAGFVSPVTLE